MGGKGNKPCPWPGRTAVDADMVDDSPEGHSRIQVVIIITRSQCCLRMMMVDAVLMQTRTMQAVSTLGCLPKGDLVVILSERRKNKALPAPGQQQKQPRPLQLP